MLRARFITTGLAALVAMAIAPAVANAAPASFVDDTFAGGTADANTQVVAPGSVQLKPKVAIDEGFAGTTLPSGWTDAPWNTGGAATVTGGALIVNGTLVGPTATYNAGQSLRFTATFGNALNRHVGFGNDFNSAPWAMFSTGNGSALPLGLYARTLVGSTAIDTPIAGVDPTTSHDYEIRWFATEVQFYVDGVLKSSQTVTLPTGLRVLASDFDVDTSSLSVDKLALSSYPASGTFTSRVFDAGPRLTAWGALTATGTLTGATLTTRSGDTPTPDASWSTPAPLGTGGAIQSPVRRYLQYQATLTSTGPTTPSLDKVEVAYDVAPTPPAGGGTTPPAGGGTTPPPSGGGGPVVLPARDRSAPKVVLSPRSLRVARSGKVAFRVKCPRTEQRCKVTLQLKRGRTTAASKSVTIRGGKTVKVTLRLRNSVRTYLSTHARLKVTAVTVARDAAGNRATKRVKVTLRAPARA